MDATPLEWLYQTQWFGVKLGLGNMTRLLREALANPAPGVKVLHVAGTNGKGSTCAFAASVAAAHGIRTGLFTSPHLVDFRERIRVNDEMIDAGQLDAELSALRVLVANWDPHPTFFELALALALRHFKNQRCELIVLETGMGGRLDATNAVQSSVCVLTPIAMDHAEWLGDTLAKIAAEKTGIFKQDIPVVVAPQHDEAMAVIKQSANMVRCPLHLVEQPLHGYPIGLPGDHQRVNAALAVEALYRLDIPLRADGVGYGLANTRWPGRFDYRADARLVLDGAHNPAGAEVLATTWLSVFPGQHATLIFSALTDKDPLAILTILRPIAARIILCPIDSPRARSLDDLAIIASNAGFPNDTIHRADNLRAAIATASGYAEISLVTGSLYLIGQAIALLEQSVYQPSNQ